MQIQQQQDQVDQRLEQLDIVDQNDDNLSEAELKKRTDMYKELRPKDDGGYKKLFWNWIEDFHKKYLVCENDKSTPL